MCGGEQVGKDGGSGEKINLSTFGNYPCASRKKKEENVSSMCVRAL